MRAVQNYLLTMNTMNILSHRRSESQSFEDRWMEGSSKPYEALNGIHIESVQLRLLTKMRLIGERDAERRSGTKIY